MTKVYVSTVIPAPATVALLAVLAFFTIPSGERDEHDEAERGRGQLVGGVVDGHVVDLAARGVGADEVAEGGVGVEGQHGVAQAGVEDHARLADLLFGGDWDLPLLARPASFEKQDALLLAAAALARGNSKTGGFRCRFVPLSAAVSEALRSTDKREMLNALAKAQVQAIGNFDKALAYALVLAIADGDRGRISRESYAHTRTPRAHLDRFADDIHYKGGCLLNENLGWGATMWAYSSRAPDPALREDWREVWLQRLEAEPFLSAVWLRHQRRDAYWRHGSVCEDYASIKAKVLAVGGWGDGYKNAVPQIVENIPGAKGIVGPWVHKYPHFAVPEPRIGFLQESLRWWDQWLKGTATGVEDDPDLRLYLMDGVRPARWYTERPGRWIADGETRRDTLHLTDAGLSHETGPLSASIASPADCGADSGEYCAIWLGPEMPGDQRRDDALSVCFDAESAEAETDIVGAPDVQLTLTSDQPQAQIAVRLCDVHPDGASTRITYGVLNLSHRTGAAEPQPLTPGEPVEVTVRLDHIAYRLKKGHRLRVAVSNAYWPLIWPSPKPTTLQITEGRLSLPVRPQATGDEWQFPPPDAAPAREVRMRREAVNSRRTETDHVTGEVSLVIEDDFGLAEDLSHGLISGGIARERWTIHPDDPLSARGACHWTEEMQRDDVTLRTETRSEMWSDAQTFYLRASLEAFENESCIYRRDFEDKVPRDNL